MQSLKDELNQYFRTIHVDPLRDPPKAVLRPTNGHLVVKGNWVNEIRAYMAEQGL